MMVIYHSHGRFPAYLAAAMHVGWLSESPPTGPEAERVWAELSRRATGTHGLCSFGADRSGRLVYAFGRASRPDVVIRAFRGLAAVCGVERSRFALQHVWAPTAIHDLVAEALEACGLARLARRVRLRALQSGWPVARAAAERVHARLGP